MSDCPSGSASMHSFIDLVIFAVIGVCVGHAKSFVTLSCSSDVTGQYGQTSVLECKVSTSEEVENPEITWVSWKKEGVQDSVLLYRRQDLEAKEGYSFGQQSWKKSMDVSLRIENTTVKHEGKYRCQVGMSSGKADGESRLHVTAKYSVPAITFKPEKSAVRPGGELECKTSGGYPKGQIRWFDGNNVAITERVEMEEIKTDGGLFQLSSGVKMKEFNFSNTCTCAVFNAKGGREHETTFEFYTENEVRTAKNTQDYQIKIMAPVVVIGSCIVGLLLVLLVCRWRRQYRNPQEMTYEVEPLEDNASVEYQKTEDVEALSGTLVTLPL